MKVLAGDVGGTNARLAICEVTPDGRVSRIAESTRPSRAYESFAEVVRTFVAAHGIPVRAVCFGLPGPVRGRCVRLTNLPWIVDADQLERDLGLPGVVLLNDLAAQAYGLVTLSEIDTRDLRPGSPDATGNQALIAAGTGLGQAGLCRRGRELHPFATEGGHTDFAPINDLEYELLKFLQDRFGVHISWERIVSGPGLVNVYEFFKHKDGGEEPEWLTDELEHGDPAAVITQHALSGKSEACRLALDLFMELYGAEAGNLALKTLATGGLYLGGGIAPKLAQHFTMSKFMHRFDQKGRMKAVVEQIPVKIIMQEATAIQGAARYAAMNAGPQD